MDFETLNPAIPRFAGMWPYSQIPFQWSVHRQVAPNAQLEHFEFLAEDERDPRREFIESLCGVLGKRGHIVVYNAGFESQRLSELADWLPKYKERIENINERLWDLWPFVRRHVYHPEFRGSFSIKSVLPDLVPGMTYERMEVSHGSERTVNAFLHYCFESARDIVDSQWPQVTAVAAALLAQYTLTYEETLEVIMPGAKAKAKAEK